MRNSYKTLLNGKISLGRSICKWDNDIKNDFTEIGCGSVTEIWWVWFRNHCWAVVNIKINLWVL